MKLNKIFLPKYKTDLKRIGSQNDGGYPMSTKILEKNNYLFSIGLGDDWSFEKESKEINAELKIFMFDGTVNIKNWLKKIIKEIFQLFLFNSNFKKVLDIFILYFKYLFFFNNKKNYHIKKNIIGNDEKGENNNQVLKFRDILNFRKKNENIILKIDIEGNEYRIFDEIIKCQNIIEFLIIEFHEVDLMEAHIEKFIKKFKLDLVHVHINNFGGKNKYGYGKVVEAMFSKRKYNTRRKKSENKFPNKFYDQPNDKNRKDERIVFK